MQGDAMLSRLATFDGHRKRAITCTLSFLVAVCLLSSADAGLGSIRGIEPSLQLKYSFSGGQFTCLSSEKVISAEKVNDNYCDCIDGSDEPGTSACPNGHFHCRNRGHTPLLLNSSFVDDGYCDCCDGSDESSHKCPNTCAAAGAENRAALKQKSSTFGAGVKQRRKYISQGVSQRQKWEQELKEKKQQEQQLQREVSKLRGKKEKIEKLEAKQRQAEELRRKLQEEKEAAENPTPNPTESPEGEVTASGSKTSIADLQAESQNSNSKEKTAEETNEEFAQKYLAESRGEVAGIGNPEFREAAKEELTEGTEKLSAEELARQKEEQLEEEGRRIASQWTSDPAAAAQEAQEQEKTEQADPAQEETSADAGDSSDESSDEDSNDADESLEDDRESGGFLEWVKRLLFFQPWEGQDPMSEKAKQKIKDAFHSQDGKLSETSRQKEDLERKLGNDFGPDDVFLTLMDRCVSTNVDKYVYEVCFFGNAAQKDGGMSTSLGRFSRFENDFKTMVFEAGQGCWNGPMRSIRVELECGKKEELSGVDEPNRCSYQAKMTTPAVCSDLEYQSVLDEVKSMEDQLADKSEF